MKMRKKIAALLAVVMIATVMPMTAFASSKNRVSHTVVAKKDDTLHAGTAPKLRIELEDQLDKDLEFYLELENAEWAKEDVFTTDGAIEANVTVRRIGDKTLAVKANVNLGTNATDKVILIPLATKLTGGEATVAIDSRDTVVSSGKFVFATSSDAKAKAKVGDISTFADNGKLAKLTFEESYIGAFKAKADDTKTITIELNDKNFKFIEYGEIKVTKSFTAPSPKITGSRTNDQKVTFTIPADVDFVAAQRGALEIVGLEIQASNKASEGDVEVYIDGYFFEDETLVVAKYGDYTTSLKTKEVEEFTAGKKETVKFTLAEVAKGAINKDRATTFTFSDDIEVTEVKLNGHTLTLKDVIDADDANIFVVSNFKDEKTKNSNTLNDDNEAKFEVKINIPAKFEGDLKVTAEGRSLEEAKEVTLAEVAAPVTVKVEPMKIVVGTKDNDGGKITITETDKKMINRGLLVIQLPEDLVYDGVSFTNVKDLDLKTTGGIKVEEAKYNSVKSAIEIEVTRQSTEAGSIEISGFEVKANRTIADGAYEIEIGGKAISDIAVVDKYVGEDSDDDRDLDRSKYKKLDAITEVDFILVGDKLTKAEVSFVIGSNVFLVDGKEVEMDAAAYIKDGRTMVPLRFLATALGIDTESIKFNSGIVTILDGNARVIQVQVGSKNLVINGMAIPMVAAAEIIEGRTYVPVTEIGAVFGVTGNWDPATQTATFK